MNKWILGIILAVLLAVFSYATSAVIFPSYNTETDCRSCHGITADRHHQLVANGTFQCTNCHQRLFNNQTQINYTQVIRNCLVCHPGKNHTQVHHLMVANGKINPTTGQPFVCTDCHPVKYDNQSGKYYTVYTSDCTVCHSTVRSIQNVTPTPAPIPTPPPETIIPGSPQIKLTTNRMVILDDPSGWDGGNITIPITDRGNQWSAESTTIRWYVLLLDSQGRAAQNITVSSQILFPNGSVALVKTNLTNNFGIAAFAEDLDRWLNFNGSESEGTYTINASATVNNSSLTGSYNFIYDEWGCGSSGSGCHASQYWQGGFGSKNASTFAAGSVQNSPYLHAWDNFHSSSGHGFIVSFGLIGNGECLTCHRGYDGVNRTHNSPVTPAVQYPSGVHVGKVPCAGCHSVFNRSTMPIPQCYDCHPFGNVTNENLTVRTYSQTATSGFSYQPLINSSIMAHAPGNNISCILCHEGMHNVSKPLNATGTSNTFTEYQQCTVCHTRVRHNGSVSCTVCHSQDAHAINVLAQNATYIQGARSADRGNCTNCHQNSSFLDALLSQPKAGAFTESAPQVSKPMNHSNDINAGRKWNQTPGYWINGTDGSAQLSSCKYCHGDTLHRSVALGRPSLWKGNNTVNSTLASNTSWCASCHYQGYVSGMNTYNDMAGAFTGDNLPVPPEITGNATHANQSASGYFNHSNIAKNDSTCKGCHGSLLTPGTKNITGFMHNVAVGAGGPDCALCHDINGIAPKRIDFSSFKKGVHRNLNSFATNNTSLSDMVDKACWACHGDGNEPDGHPLNYKTPKNCNSNDCHSLSQSSYNEPMIYSHFQNASLNDNPNNVTNYNITASVQCQFCHINSLVRTDNYPQQALVSHYASRDNLIDSFNCTYCHRVKNNSEVWGNATLIYKNTTSLIELEKERNKLTAYEGESIYLGNGYSLKVVEISTERSEALMQLFKNYSIVDEFSLRVGVPYNYEEYITIDNGTFRTPVIILNMTSIFKGGSKSLIQYSGFRTARVHAETNSTSCLACHLYRYSPEKKRYLVIDRETKDIPRHDIIYYTDVLIDFISENKSKIYYDDDDHVLSQINTNFGRFLTSPTSQKYLAEGETWDIGENVSLKLNAVATDSKQALLSLMIDNSVVEESAVKTGSEYNYIRPIRYKGYVDTNVTIFSAKLASVAQANPNFVILKDVVAISPFIRQTTANTTVFGFNSSWLFPNDTFIVGKVPENFHAPNLFTDQRTWADCVKCHDTSRKLNIPDVDAISSRLGKHDRLNLNASSVTILSDSIDKACWACHTLDGKEPNAHSPTYVTPRYCKSCHVYQENPSFGAINISDEPHALEQNCPACHIQNSHTLIRFEVTPVIKEISLSKTQVSRNETIHLVAEAIAGYRFKIRAAEYFIDEMGMSGNGMPLKPVDGEFDSQMENVTSDINTSGIAPGEHTLYIHAMERNNRWGEFSSVNFTIADDKPDTNEKTTDISIVVLIIGFVAAYLVVSRHVQR